MPWLQTLPPPQKNFAETADFAEITAHYRNVSDSLLGISVVNRNYAFIGEKTYEPHQLSWHFNTSLFQKAEGYSIYWTPPHMLVDSATGEISWSISCITPIVANGELLGYLILYLDRSRLDHITRDLFDTAYIINDSEYSLYSQESWQECYVLSDKSYSSEPFNPYTANFYSRSNIDYNYLINNSSTITSVNGTMLTITTRKYPRMGWIFLIVSPYTDITQNALSYLSRMLVVGAASIIFALISAHIISRTFSRPIRLLNETIQKVTDGNLDIRHQTISNDEIGTLALAFNSLLDTIQELVQNISEQQKNRRRLQLQLIQAQVKPHFLYNVLEMISSFIRERLDGHALDSITHLAQFYRTSLSDGSDIISIDKEIDMTENYLALQHLRYIEFMDFSMEISKEIGHYQIPKLTLQPIVENAIYHGLKAKCEKGHLKIKGYQKENFVIFEIYDNGVGMSKETIVSIMDSFHQETLTKDFGISSVVKRLNIHFHNEAVVEIQSELGTYTNFILSFPAKVL